MDAPMEVSLVIPAYNEDECIADAVAEVRQALRKTGRSFELVVVDDGSVDRTFSILRRLKPGMPELRALCLTRHCGQTAAMDAGFAHARGDIVITMDADRQNDPADIPRLLEMTNEWDVVCGRRRKREDNLVRRISSRIANRVRNRLTRETIRDTGCTLKAFRRTFLARVKLFEGMHRFLPTLLRLEGARVTEVEVGHRPRLRGESKYGVWNRLFRSLRDLFAVRWMQSRWIRYEIGEEIE